MSYFEEFYVTLVLLPVQIFSLSRCNCIGYRFLTVTLRLLGRPLSRVFSRQVLSAIVGASLSRSGSSPSEWIRSSRAAFYVRMVLMATWFGGNGRACLGGRDPCPTISVSLTFASSLPPNRVAANRSPPEKIRITQFTTLYIRRTRPWNASNAPFGFL